MARPRSRDADRVQLGDFWLEYRAERDDWGICWYDAASRTRRRRSTGIGGGHRDDIPDAAREALADHYLESRRPAEPQQPGDMPVAELFTAWLRDHVAGIGDPVRYGTSVKHWLRFFARERAAGRVTDGVMVADITKRFVTRFINWRKAEGVGGHTISRDLAALRAALRHGWKDELITAAPFVRDVDPDDKAKPRDLVYTMDQVAGLLEAAWRLPERQHVHLYTLIALSTLGRGEAILELHSRQLRGGLIHFLDDDRDQTSKRRSIVPITPTLAPWLEGIEGKVIRYRAEIAEKNREPGGPAYFERECHDLGNSFDACLIEAGMSRRVLDDDGEPVMLPPRRRLGETESRLALRGLGTPNTLRHTIITEMHKRGVPEAQIETAAGHLGTGTNKRNYRHLRPDYLVQLIGAIEDYWEEMRHLTTVHLRSQCGPNLVSFAAARAGLRIRNG